MVSRHRSLAQLNEKILWKVVRHEHCWVATFDIKAFALESPPTNTYFVFNW